ncbi:unnamed protein product [Ilex paraguariensis]|uniref:C2H2-type domain-containing protein n=1 Tax=Ilex paraguariensis TaxID=185542 RepID=A0ABC8SJL9_9AQUA
MAAELGLLSLTQLQKLAQSQQKQINLLNPSSTSGSWMWNPTQAAEDDNDDSWEVRAFAEDAANIEGTTWPPRSYTCTFCRREFRSAQALGGHMNVHRRDRARLHQTPPGSTTSPSAASSTLLIPNQKTLTNGGICFLYSLPNPNGLFTPTIMTGLMDPPSTALSISPHTSKNLSLPCPPCIDLPATRHSINSSLCHSSKTEPSTSFTNDSKHDNGNTQMDLAIEELDLELRLGRRSSPSRQTKK